MNAYNNWQKNKILLSKSHQLKASEEINNLVVNERNGREITLSTGEKLIEFMSCSYLGLDQERRVVDAAIRSIHKCGVNFAVARTRLRVESSVELERYLNKIFRAHCVTFTSLHLTHLGIFPLLASGEMPSYPTEHGIVFILDKKSHASIQIQRGLLSQFGEIYLINFNEIEKVEAHCKKAHKNQITPILIADGVCSMGGLIPVKTLIHYAEQYKGYVYLDDAHGISIQGKHGCGYVLNALDGFHPRLLLAISLSKGFGTNGAAIAVPTEDDEKIIRRYANPYLFSNPLPLSIVDSSIASAKIHLSDEIYNLQEKLLKNIRYFDSLMKDSPFHERIINFNSFAPIRGILIGDEYETIAITQALRKNKLAVTAAMYPTVAKGQSILRLAFGANHNPKDIQRLSECLLTLLNCPPPTVM